MTEIKFYDIGFFYLTVDKVIDKAVKYIKDKNFDNEIKLDFHSCLLCYDSSKIFDAVINKLKELQDEKIITINHTYNESHPTQILGYLTRESEILNLPKEKTHNINEVNNILITKYEITLKFIEDEND